MSEALFAACSRQAEGKALNDEVCSVCKRLLDPNQHTCKTLIPQVAVDAVNVIHALKADAMRFRKLCAILETVNKSYPNTLETGATTVLCSMLEKQGTVTASIAWQAKDVGKGVDLRKLLDQLSLDSNDGQQS